MPTALSAVAPFATAALIGFVCPQRHRLRRAEVARVGFLVAPHHYCGQDTPATGTLHQHSPARAFLLAPRTYPASPCLLHTFVRINKDVDHFCLCRSDTACASEASCSDATPPRAIDGVWWHHLVSYPRAVLGHCDQLSHTRYTLDSMHTDRVAILGPY